MQNRVKLALITTMLGAFMIMVVRLVRAYAPMRGVCATGRLAEGLWAVRDRGVAGFVVSDGTTAIAIDAGMNAARFARGLATLPVDPASVEALYLTHSDRDHIAGIGLYPKARVVLPEAEVPVVMGAIPRRMLGLPLPARPNFPQPYATIADGEIVTHGTITIRAIHTPGHTPGATSDLVNGRWLFTGDLLMLRNGVAEVTWPAINNDTAQSIAGIRRLATGMDGLLDGVELLVTAHTGCSADCRGALAPFRENGPEKTTR
jgi:glyoxylase-like metal-dependent hydrolase (beta-lactamase superfamily II)